MKLRVCEDRDSKRISLLECRGHDKRVVNDSVWRARSDLDKSEA